MVRSPASATSVEFEQVPITTSGSDSPPLSNRSARLDWGLAAGFGVSAFALLLSAGVAGIGLALFLQPSALLIVLGGTLGATLVTTPSQAMGNALRRMRALLRRTPLARGAFLDEIVGHARVARIKGMMQLEDSAQEVEDPMLREGLMLAVDGLGRDDIAAAMELQLRLMERQGEADAQVFESAGGFAPTIGVMGTVMGLLTVMHQFSDIAAVASGVGTAFVSTLYGLGLANLILLPVANRIRASAAESYEVGEMAMDGVLCIRDGHPPRIVRERLRHYVR